VGNAWSIYRPHFLHFQPRFRQHSECISAILGAVQSMPINPVFLGQFSGGYQHTVNLSRLSGQSNCTDVITIPPSVARRAYQDAIESVFKLVYLAIHSIAKKWTMPIRDWKPALNRPLA
jgi:hypothetical protein